jgi:hypothetical protein
MSFSCILCHSKRHGKFTGQCGHEMCGKCFLHLHADAVSAPWSQTRSKCPFCRQVFPFEEESIQKLKSCVERTNALRRHADMYRKEIRVLLKLRKQLLWNCK